MRPLSANASWTPRARPSTDFPTWRVPFPHPHRCGAPWEATGCCHLYQHGYAGDAANSGRLGSSKQESQLSLQSCTFCLGCSCFLAGFHRQLVPSITVTLHFDQSISKLGQFSFQPPQFLAKLVIKLDEWIWLRTRLIADTNRDANLLSPPVLTCGNGAHANPFPHRGFADAKSARRFGNRKPTGF